MSMKNEFENLSKKLATERELIKSKLHQASIEVNKEFVVAEKQWQSLKHKMAEIADESQENSEELIAKAKLEGEHLKQRYHEISQRLLAKASSTQTELETSLATLRVERDEIKLQIHLASMDVQKAFEPTEKQLQTLKVEVANIADATIEGSEALVADAKIVADELSKAYQHIKQRIAK
ncbi:MAG: hypothetical protein PF440_06420 [Thiomicrorhabdus sp.]|jgi:hypothetical protein|nr:hypothetical protein [Thiomicrorhabdus sp.]